MVFFLFLTAKVAVFFGNSFLKFLIYHHKWSSYHYVASCRASSKPFLKCNRFRLYSSFLKTYFLHKINVLYRNQLLVYCWSMLELLRIIRFGPWDVIFPNFLAIVALLNSQKFCGLWFFTYLFLILDHRKLAKNLGNIEVWILSEVGIQDERFKLHESTIRRF